MADIKLNKPLYNDKDSGDFTPPTPRPPKPSLLGRAAALFLDIMLLRLVFAVLVRFLPDPILALGPIAPWVGLLIGWAYFGVGFSHITLGRTLGKLILRVQVAELQGPDLPVGRAFYRAAVLLWPLPVLLALRLVAEHFANTDPTNIYTTVEVFGWMLIVGWGFGNLMFAGFDPFGRAVHDRLASSIVINAELEPAPVAQYMTDARAAAARPLIRKSVTGLGFALVVCMAFAAASSLEVMRQLRDLSDEERQRAQAMVHPPYGRAWPAPPTDDTPTTAVLPVTLNFRTRGKLDIESIKAEGNPNQTLERIIGATLSSNFTNELRDYLNSANFDRARRGEQATSIPERLKFDVGYAEYADLFFASEAHPVYTISRTVDMPTTVAQTLMSGRVQD